MITLWGMALGVSAAAIVVALLSAYLGAWPDEPKPNQWKRYKGVMRLREDNRREPVLDTAAFAKWLRSKPTQEE